MKRIGVLLVLLFAVGLISCSADKTDVKKKSNQTEQNTEQSKSTDTGCDPSLWDHVYDPSRLEVRDKCKVVTGIVKELGENEDGDTHLLLKLDPGQEDLLTKRNIKKKDGNLVAEVVCANKITDKKAVEACRGFSNSIALPAVGDHVRVTGSYVLDSHNDWAEIHPVSKIEK